MKFALAQLGNFKMPYSYDENLDLSSDLDGFEDILSSSICKCHTVIERLDVETYKFEFHINIELTIFDAVTLDELPFDIDVDGSEIYTTIESYEDASILDSNTIDTKEAILCIILENKPYAQSSQEFESYKDALDDDEDAEDSNPFAELKDLL